MWSVLKAGWIYELEAAKWDLDLDRINLAAKFRIGYWGTIKTLTPLSKICTVCWGNGLISRPKAALWITLLLL